MEIQQPKYKLGQSCYFIKTVCPVKDRIENIIVGYAPINQIYLLVSEPDNYIYDFIGFPGSGINESQIYDNFTDFTKELEIILNRYNAQREKSFYDSKFEKWKGSQRTIL